jgi:hypothetical protein
MMNFIFVVLQFSLWASFSLASDDHPKNSHNHEEHNEGEDEHTKKGHDEHEEEEEISAVVGPDKGILQKGEAGFKLSPEAFSTMALKISDYSGGTFTLPSKAVVQIKNEKTVFRLRDGWLKRVAVEIVQKNNDSLIISSTKFRNGDQIVTEGSGFLRIAEIFSEEGASHGHSH